MKQRIDTSELEENLADYAIISKRMGPLSDPLESSLLDDIYSHVPIVLNKRLKFNSASQPEYLCLKTTSISEYDQKKKFIVYNDSEIGVLQEYTSVVHLPFKDDDVDTTGSEVRDQTGRMFRHLTRAVGRVKGSGTPFKNK